MRVSCPFCARHRGHWSVLNWTAGVGWLVGGLVFAGLGFLIGSLFTASLSSAPYIGLAVGAGIGILAWIGVLITLAVTRIDATKVTKDAITLKRVADGFARAVGEQEATKV
jgi:hypothetical protein